MTRFADEAYDAVSSEQQRVRDELIAGLREDPLRAYVSFDDREVIDLVQLIIGDVRKYRARADRLQRALNDARAKS
jgi:hypothetical protein